MHKSSKQQSNLQLLSTEKLTLVNEQSTKLAMDDPTWVIESAVLNSEGLLEILMFFALVLLVQNGPKLKIVIKVTPLLQANSFLLLVQVGYRFPRISPEVLIEISLVLIVHGNENPFQHVLFCIFIVNSTKMSSG